MPQLAPFTIYNASAGSGKTFTLVKEYLKILLRSKNQEAFKHILAITFTNKAVGEMKLRLIETLKQFSQTSILEQPNTMFTLLCEELNLDAKTLHLKSKTVLDAILHNYGAFDISTIDRFTHKIIRTFAKDLKLSLNFEVELDVDNLLNQAVDNLIAKAGSDKLLTKTLVDFALEKVDDDKSWDVSYDLNSIAKLLVKENDLPYLEALKHKSLEDFKALKESLTETISKAEKQIIESAQNVLDFIAECGLEHSDFSSGYLPKHFGNLSNGNFDIKFDNKWQQEIESKALYPARVKGSEALTMDRIQPQLVKAFYQTRDAVYQWGFYKAVYRNITPLSVLNAINQELEQIKLDENKVLISEFNSIISSEIKNQPTPFIYERLGEKFKHYFIDEFQDTSKMQWQNLRPLIANAIEQEQVGQNGSLMLVGDAKQAIYRWRGGEAEQFIDLYNKAVEPFHLEPKVENLDYNFRSFQEVIKFNNAFFEYLSRNAFENLDYGHLYQQSKQHAYHKEDGCVSLQFLSIERDDDKDLLYCDQVYKTVISCLENGYSQSDLCVLVRKNEQGVAVSNYLAEKGLRIISSESMLLNNSPQVRFLNDLLTLLVQPKNMEVKVSILYFLAKQFQITDIHAFISDRLQLSFEVLVRDLEQYNIQLQTRDLLQQTLFDTVETLARAFYLTKTSNAYIQFYLDTVLEFSERNTNDMASFLDYFDKKKEKLSIVSSEGQDAIRVMTIHKSKGLEFPVVIFPYAELNIYKEVSPKEWFPLDAEKFHEFPFALLNYNGSFETFGESGIEIYNRHQAQLELDNINLLYVALTRPVEQLHVIGKLDFTQGNPNSKTYSGLFIQYLMNIGLWQEDKTHYVFGKPKRTIQGNSNSVKAQEAQDFISVDKAFHNISIITKSGYLWDTAQEAAIEKGNLVHLILSKIKFETDVESALEETLLEAVIDKEQLDSLKTAVNEIVNHSLLNPYFKTGLQVYNEQDIITQNGTILRPDRLVLLPNQEAVLIDYKTGKPKQKDNSQMELYGQTIQDMGLTVKKKILVYLDTAIVVKEL